MEVFIPYQIRRTKHVKWQLFRPLPSAPPQPLFLVSSLGSLLNINPPISSYSCKNRLSRLSERHPTFSGTTICLDEETCFFHDQDSVHLLSTSQIYWEVWELNQDPWTFQGLIWKVKYLNTAVNAHTKSIYIVQRTHENRNADHIQ